MVALLHLFLAHADALTGFALPRMPGDVAKMFMAHISPEWISRRPVGGVTNVGLIGSEEAHQFLDAPTATVLTARRRQASQQT